MWPTVRPVTLGVEVAAKIFLSSSRCGATIPRKSMRVILGGVYPGDEESPSLFWFFLLMQYSQVFESANALKNTQYRLLPEAL